MEGGQDRVQVDDDRQNDTANGSDSGNASGEECLLRSIVPTAELKHSNRTSLEPASLGHRQLLTSSVPQTIGKPNVKDTKPSGFGLHLKSIANFVQNGSTISMKSKESGSVNIDSKSLKPLEPVSCDKRSYSTTICEINEELSQSSQKKKRFRDLDFSDDGGKHCKCKMTRCLRPLCCDCKAAGIYCTESCSCQGCFNRPNKDTVKDTRQQIDSLTPLAFAPKITQQATKASTKGRMENVNLISSVRHTRVCRCKKNTCSKRTCSCFHATVGCSDRCKCEGCKNVYGRKEVPEYENTKHVSVQEKSEPNDVSSGGKMQVVASTDGTLCSQQFSPHELTPQTPLSQNSNYGKDRSESWFSSGKHPPSPKSTAFADSNLNSSGPSGNISNHGSIEDFHREIVREYPYLEELYYENLSTTDDIFPTEYGQGSINDIPQTPSLQNTKHLCIQDIGELNDVSSGGKMLKVASTDGTLCTQQFSPHELRLQTPMSQNSNYGKDRSESQFCSRRHLPSPESAEFADSNLNSPGPSGNISNYGIIKDVNKDILDLDPFQQELGNGKL